MSTLDRDHQHMVASEISHAARMAGEAIQQAASYYTDPSIMFRPKIYVDGNQWCALYGENLQDGVAGFGDSPAEAMRAFDRAWTAKIEVPA